MGRRKAYGLGLAAVALLVIAVPFCQTLWLLALNFIGIGVAYAFVLPAWNGILLRLLPKDVRGAGLGILMTAEGLGGVIGPLIGGLLWQVMTPSAPFFLSGGLLLLASSAATHEDRVSGSPAIACSLTPGAHWGSVEETVWLFLRMLSDEG